MISNFKREDFKRYGSSKRKGLISNAFVESTLNMSPKVLTLWSRADKNNYRNRIYWFIKSHTKEELEELLKNAEKTSEKRRTRRSFISNDVISEHIGISARVLSSWSMRDEENYRNKLYWIFKLFTLEELKENIKKLEKARKDEEELEELDNSV